MHVPAKLQQKLLIEFFEPRLIFIMRHIVIYKPIDSRIHGHIHLGIVQCGNAGEHDGGTIGLNRRSRIEIIHVLKEDPHGNLFVGIIPGHVYSYQGDKLDLGMLLKRANDFLFGGICRNHIQQF